MTKSCFAFWLAVCLAAGLWALPATAALSGEMEVHSTNVGEFTWEYTLANGQATIILYEEWARCEGEVTSKITIPSKLDGYSVTAIGERLLSGCDWLTSIKIPKGVTVIGDYAFHIYM